MDILDSQMLGVLLGEDEPHRTMAEGAVSIGDEPGYRNGELDEVGAAGGPNQKTPDMLTAADMGHRARKYPSGEKIPSR